MYTSTVIHLTFYTTNSQKDYAEITLTPRVSNKDVKMSDTGFDSSHNAMAETAKSPELYASQYAHDAEFARLIACWGSLSNDDRLELAEHAERLASVISSTESSGTMGTN